MITGNHELYVPPPKTSNIMRAWEAFQSGEPVPHSNLRPLVLQSWQRSRSLAVDPQLQKAPLQRAQLQANQLANDDLIRAALPVLDETVELLEDQNALVLLCSPEGLVLESRGNRPSQEAGIEANIVPGGLWHEEVSGTNAVGTALATQHAIQVYASEHYCAGVKNWTCAASLVHDPVDGRLLGALDISYQSEALDRFALPLIVSAARRVESILRQMLTMRHNLLLEKYIDCLPQYGNDGLLLVNKQGLLLQRNEKLDTILENRGVDSKVLANGYLGCSGNAQQASFKYPEWINADWITPVRVDGCDVGAIVHIPAIGSTRNGQEQSTRRPPARLTSRLADHHTPSMKRVVETSLRVASFDLPVMIQGETGTGKEVVARAIHDLGPRHDKPFIVMNCGAVPRELLASELFGYEEGAFTGARRGGAQGKFEQAHGGTLFLDELGELPLDLQPYLLRALEDRTVTRLGSSQTRPVDVRIIAATNRDLLEQMQMGDFREDLYYRFRASIDLPPLRERTQDIDRYLDAALASAASDYGFEKRLDDALRDRLRTYSYPGNLRELHNIIEHMVIMTDAPCLTLDCLPPLVAERMEQIQAWAHPPGDLRATEQQAIEQALTTNAGNHSAAARQLGISRATLYRRLKQYDEATVKPTTAASRRRLNS